SPFGDPTDDEIELARMEKCLSDGDGSMRKSANPFSVGDPIRDKQTGRLGRVTLVKAGAVEITWEDGTHGTSVLDYVERADLFTKSTTGPIDHQIDVIARALASGRMAVTFPEQFRSEFLKHDILRQLIGEGRLKFVAAA